MREAVKTQGEAPIPSDSLVRTQGEADRMLCEAVETREAVETLETFKAREAIETLGGAPIPSSSLCQNAR